MNIIIKLYFRLINYFVYLKCSSNKYIIGKGAFFRGYPYLHAVKGSKIIIGSHVHLNSSNYKSHLSMYSNCKIMADRPGAVIRIGDNTRVASSCIHAWKKIEIGRNCGIAANCQIIDSNGHELSMDNPEHRFNTTGTGKDVVIEDNVWIGTNCVILPGTRIGMGSVVSAGSIVKGIFPEKCIIAGNPAIVIKQYL